MSAIIAVGLALPLFAYQLRWLADLSRFKIYCKARQVGVTWIETLDLVQRCLAKKQKWYYLSVSQDRAAEAIAYAAQHCLAMGMHDAKITTGWMKFERIKFAHCTITFPNGSQIIGLPANARTARGCSGNLVLDEFAHHIDAAAIWKAAHAIALWGYHLHIISTPNGQQGEFYEIWTNSGGDCDRIEDAIRAGYAPVDDRWSRHWTDIHAAKADGHPVDIAEARDLARTDTTWEQEYLCKFLDESLAWLPYSLIDSCTTDRATLTLDSTQPPAGSLYLGNDIGRKHDRSIIWLNEKRDVKSICRAVISMENTPYAQQKRILWDLMPMVARGHIDETGIGANLAEDTVTKFGELRAKGVSFTAKQAAILATLNREALETKQQELPDCPNVRRGLHMVRRTYTEKGSQTFEAPRTKDGHADEFWAMGLALEAQKEAIEGLKKGDYAGGGSRSRHESVSVDRGDYGGYS